MSSHGPRARARPLPLCSGMHVLLTLSDRGRLVLCSSVMGALSSCTHVPCPPPAPTGAKRTLAASSSQPPNGLEPGGQPLKTRTLSGMASKTTSTVTPKRVAHSPSLQVSTPREPGRTRRWWHRALPRLPSNSPPCPLKGGFGSEKRRTPAPSSATPPRPPLGTGQPSLASSRGKSGGPGSVRTRQGRVTLCCFRVPSRV